MALKLLRILFEDRYLVAIDKPAGIHTAPLNAGESGTLLSLIIERYPEIARVPGIKAVEPGLLHRLDYETSGIIIIARTESSFRGLQKQFESDKVSKEYIAACISIAKIPSKGKSLHIESMFAPFGQGGKMVRVVLPSEKKKRIARKSSRDIYKTAAEISARKGNIVLVKARITRGFRHQIRAHLEFLGFPIIGDPLYGVPVPHGFPERMYLHASRIKLLHPETSKPLIIESPLPPEFEKIFPLHTQHPMGRIKCL